VIIDWIESADDLVGDAARLFLIPDSRITAQLPMAR